MGFEAVCLIKFGVSVVWCFQNIGRAFNVPSFWYAQKSYRLEYRRLKLRITSSGHRGRVLVEFRCGGGGVEVKVLASKNLRSSILLGFRV